MEMWIIKWDLSVCESTKEEMKEKTLGFHIYIETVTVKSDETQS